MHDNLYITNCYNIGAISGTKKAGMCLYMGKDICGKVIVCDIGFPEVAFQNALDKMDYYNVIEKEDLIISKKYPKHLI